MRICGRFFHIAHIFFSLPFSFFFFFFLFASSIPLGSHFSIVSSHSSTFRCAVLSYIIMDVCLYFHTGYRGKSIKKPKAITITLQRFHHPYVGHKIVWRSENLSILCSVGVVVGVILFPDYAPNYSKIILASVLLLHFGGIISRQIMRRANDIFEWDPEEEDEQQQHQNMNEKNKWKEGEKRRLPSKKYDVHSETMSVSFC